VSRSEGDVLHLARHFVDVNRPQDALDTLERADSGELDDPDYWSLRAAALLGLDRDREAADAASRGLALDAEDIELLYLLAVAQIAQELYGKADVTLRKALELAPDNPLLLARRGVVLALMRDVSEAQRAISKAMSLAPDDTDVLRARAHVAVLTSRPNAAKYVDELLERDPEDPIGHALRGNLALEQGQYVSASRAFDKAARLDPASTEVTRAAREARVPAHPLLAPVRLMWRFGRWRSYFLYLTIVMILAAARLETLRIAVIAVWLTIVVLSWVGPRFLRWWQGRRYGGF